MLHTACEFQPDIIESGSVHQRCTRYGSFGRILGSWQGESSIERIDEGACILAPDQHQVQLLISGLGLKKLLGAIQTLVVEDSLQGGLVRGWEDS
jgi:hypothetical protein